MRIKIKPWARDAIIVTMSIIGISCTNGSKNTVSGTFNDDNLSHVIIVYLPRLNTEFPYDLSGLLRDDPRMLNDTIIEGRATLRDFKDRLQQLKHRKDPTANDRMLDLRMFSLMKFMDGSIHHLLLDEYDGVIYDGQLMEKSPEFVTFVKSLSMDHYKWHPDYDID